MLSSPYFSSAIRNQVYADKKKREIFDKISEFPDLRNLHYDVEYENGSIKDLIFKPKYPYDIEFKVWLKNYSRTATQVMFPCLAKSLITLSLTTYYISYAFVEGEAFLYTYSTLNHNVQVLALIEESPHWLKFESKAKLEEFYIKLVETSGTNMH